MITIIVSSHPGRDHYIIVNNSRLIQDVFSGRSFSISFGISYCYLTRRSNFVVFPTFLGGIVFP